MAVPLKYCDHGANDPVLPLTVPTQAPKLAYYCDRYWASLALLIHSAGPQACLLL